MTAGEEAYPEGMDFVWLAGDSAGHVGAFVTAGCGPVPVEALRTQSLENVEEIVRTLSERGDARVVGAKGDLSSFAEMARRGVYVFDWTDVHKAQSRETGFYERTAEPTSPRSASDFAVPLFTFADIDFALSQQIDVRSRSSCLPRLK